MRSQCRHSERATTWPEAVVTFFIIAVLLAGILPMLQPPTSRTAIRCIVNLRQLGVACANYCIQNNGEMPPVDQNVFALTAPYVGAFTPGRGELSPYLCDQDRLNDLGDTGTSYAVNCTASDTPAGLAANARHSPFSVYPSEPVRIETTAPDTILIVEYWGRDFYHSEEYSQVRLDLPEKGPKHALRAPPGVDDPYALISSSANALFVDTAGYVQRPAAVVHEYAANQCGYRNWRGMFHRGRIAMLMADGHTDALEVRRLAAGDPAFATIWTRQAD